MHFLEHIGSMPLGQSEHLVGAADAQDARMVATPRSGLRGGGEAAAELDHHRKTCTDPRHDAWKEEVSFLVRGRDCRTGCCKKCCGRRGHNRAKAAAEVVATFKRTLFLTFTLNHERYQDKKREIFEHLRKVKAVPKTMDVMRRRGEVGRWFSMLEFQMGSRKRRKSSGPPTEQVHFHLIVEVLTKDGKIDIAAIQEAWNSFAPEWAPPLTRFSTGRLKPEVGNVDVEKIKHQKGKNAAVAYITGYLATAAKSVADWWFDYLDDGHNSQMFSPSKDFWPKCGETPVRRKPTGVKRPKRRPVRERMAACRDQFDVMRCTVTTKNGKEVFRKFEHAYRSKSKLAYWNAIAMLFPCLDPDKHSDMSGFFIDREQLGKLLRCSEIHMPRRRAKWSKWGVEPEEPAWKVQAERDRGS